MNKLVKTTLLSLAIISQPLQAQFESLAITDTSEIKKLSYAACDSLKKRIGLNYMILFKYNNNFHTVFPYEGKYINFFCVADSLVSGDTHSFVEIFTHDQFNALREIGEQQEQQKQQLINDEIDNLL
jgi:hypothetical protein